MKNIDICLSPEYIFQHTDIDTKNIVIVDIFRATSCIVTAIGSGVKAIIPLTSIEECREYKKLGYYTAGERDGKKISELDMGNSPFEYMDNSVKNKKIALTTTNGTKAIKTVENAKEIIIASFLNITTIANYLIQKEEDILIICAGRKGKISMEDSLFAGALLEKMQTANICPSNAAFLFHTLFCSVKKNVVSFLSYSDAYKNLEKQNAIDDILFCLKEDLFSVIPIYDKSTKEIHSV